MKQRIPLNYDWFYRPDFKEDYLTKDDSFAGFSPVSLPHTNKELPYNNFNEKDYQFVSCYKRILPIPEMDESDRLFLRFDGVMTVADVYLNGKLIFTHEGGYTPFSMEITNEVRHGEENVLFVKVDSREIKDIPPFGNVVDYLTYGGIYREVSLLVYPKHFIKHLAVKTLEALSLSPEDMNLVLSLEFDCDYDQSASFKLLVSKQGKPVFTTEFISQCAGKITFSTPVSGIERWDIDHPALYDLEVIASADEKLIDSVQTRIGFRTAEFTSDGFILNNKKIKLIGLDRHQSYPYVGYAMPKRIQEKDADLLRFDLGCNIVRTSHYMQSDHFINRCDEVGLLVFEEIPGWQYIGNDHFKELSVQNLKDMILTHINHPSIVLWGVRINESPDDDEFYQKTNEIAHALDDSRQTGGVRNFKKSRLFEDVYTYNDFVHCGDNQGLEEPRKVAGGRVPFLVTEHNGHMFPTKKFDPESKRLEQAMRHLKVLDDSFKHEDASGAIGWCMNDYNTHVEFGSGDRICYHGVMDMFRIPKYAAAVYSSQQKKIPVLVAASNMITGEFAEGRLSETILFTNCDYVKVYRNGVYIDTFYTAWEAYEHIPYAPVIVDDFIGNQIADNEPFSKRVADKIRKGLLSVQKNGLRMPFKDKMLMANLMVFHKLTWDRAVELYGKYLGGWGTGGIVFTYEGYMDDVLVKTVKRGSNEQYLLKAVADDTVLLHKDTYDATRIVVRLQDEFGNDLPYANDVLSLQTTPELEIIGPHQLALIGGSIGIYVKTTGKKGTGTLSISSIGREDLIINIEVQ